MAAGFIFLQIYLNLANTIDGSSLSALILGFHVCRLIQFLFSGILGIQMMQSNMVCLAIATIGLATIQSQSTLGVLASLVLVADAMLGAAIFVAKNEKEIKNSLTFVQRISSFKRSSKIS